MIADATMRRIFWAAAAVNTSGGFLFLFPHSPLGAIAGLPTGVPVAYRALVALFIWLFGGMYVVLARQAVFQRSLVWIGAIGKGFAFLIFAALWAMSHAPLRSVALMSADLVFAVFFLTWLLGSPANATAR